MATMSRSIVINAPASTVLAITEDFDRLPEWYAGIEEVRTDGVFPEVGGKADMVYKAAGVTFTIQQIVTKYEPGKRSEYELKGMISGTYAETMESEGDTTRYILDFDYEIPGGGFGKIVDKLVIERMNASQLEQSLENLKSLAEA